MPNRLRYLRWLRDPQRRAIKGQAQSEFTAAKTRLINLRVAEREGNLIEYAEAESVIDQVSGITCLIIRGRALIPRTGAGGTRVGFGYQDNGPTR